MVIDIFKEMSAYLDLLAKEQNLHIIFHDFDGFTINYSKYIPYFYPINSNNNKYCEFIMTKENSLKKCLEKQLNVLDKCKNKEAFWGMCHAGVEEFVIPLNYENKTLGFISVTGNRSDEQKALTRIDYFCNEFGFSKKQVIEKYYNYLNPNTPELEKLKVFIRPAARLLELAFKEILHNESINRQILNRETLYERIKVYIEMNYMSDINNKVLSGFFQCSPSNITHTFKKKCGMTIKGYLNCIRMKKAKEQIENSKIPISNIASNVGYTDSNYFAKVFKQIYGITPRQCRKAINL